MASNGGFCQKAVVLEQKVGQRMASWQRIKKPRNPYKSRLSEMSYDSRNEKVACSSHVTSSKKGNRFVRTWFLFLHTEKQANPCGFACFNNSVYKHRVTKAEEAILLLNCVVICLEDVFLTC